MKKSLCKYLMVASLVGSLISPLYADETIWTQAGTPEHSASYEEKVLNRLEQLETKDTPNIEKDANKGQFNIVLNGKDVTSTVPSDLKPIVSSGVTYVPVRMLEKVVDGINISYNADAKIIKIEGNNHWIMMQIGKLRSYDFNQTQLNEYIFSNDKPAMAHGRVYLPLRYAVEKLDYKVLWDSATGTVSISTTDAAPTIPDTIKAKPKTQGTYYLGGKSFTLPKGITLVTSEYDAEECYTTGEKASLIIQARNTSKPSKDDAGKEYAYSGSIRIINYENEPKADSLATQFKITEEILNQIFTKSQVKEIMEIVKKDFAAKGESARPDIVYGDVKLEIAGRRNMAASESIIFYQINK